MTSDFLSSFHLPSCVLSPCPWAGDKILARVYGALNDPGAQAPETLLVGGAVRNAVLGRPILDYDLATILPLEVVSQRAQRAGFGVVPTGITHGTVTIVAGGRGFEVTRLRRDVETDGRHARVVFTENWIEDAARRDFTLNTLYADFSGRVFEGVPGALADTRAGVIRFVGDPALRIAEDYLRILRFFRFQAHYGVGAPDLAGLSACAAAAGHLRKLSKERITGEFKKWLAAESPIETLKISFDNNILNSFLHKRPDFEMLARLIVLQRRINRSDSLLRLWILVGEQQENLNRSFLISNKEINRLECISRVSFEDQITLESLRRDAVRYGHAAVLDRYLIESARVGGEASFFAPLAVFLPPICPVTGEDLLARGVPAGPILGQILADLRRLWIASDFQPLSETQIKAAIQRGQEGR